MSRTFWRGTRRWFEVFPGLKEEREEEEGREVRWVGAVAWKEGFVLVEEKGGVFYRRRERRRGGVEGEVCWGPTAVE
jgi:hypothetical protein